MPIIYVYGFERPVAKRRQLVRDITEATCRAYEVPREIVTVYVMDVDRANAAHGGVIAADADAEAGGRRAAPKRAAKRGAAKPATRKRAAARRTPKRR